MNSTQLSLDIRRLALEMVHAANASHIGGVLSMADILGVLYTDILKVSPDDPGRPDRDRLIVSTGHCCAGVYAALATLGFLTLAELKTYGADGSRLMTHISLKVPGAEVSTGPPGHGLPFGCGKALSAKRRGQAWKTHVILSDGELDEGSNWEAILFAPQQRLDNLVAIVDYNRIQSLGKVEDVLELEPLADKWRAFRWSVREVDGHDHDALREALATAPWEPGKPSCLIARTVKGKGVGFMENELLWHYRSPNAAQLSEAKGQLRG